MNARILLVEDDPGMRQVTRVLLQRGGYRVTEAGSAEEGLASIQRTTPDLVVSDINLPGLSGVKLCEILRGDPKTAGLPVILLTVLGKPPEKVRGLQTGADDYITKPYDPREVLARVVALLRRVGREVRSADIHEFKGVRVNIPRREVIVDGKPASLRRKEFELFVFFLRHPGQLLTRDRIHQSLWGDDVIVSENTLSAHVKNLRAALGRFGDRIETMVGEGYRFNEAD